jgi:nucleoside-diphosphate-sugar epimerase
MNLLIIGRNSLLCKLFLENTRIKNFRVYSRHDLDKINFKNFTHLLNFSFNHKLQTNNYNEKIDFDLKLSKIVSKYKIIYIFLSSRLVYSGIKTKFVENLKLRPQSIYGKNKLITEGKIRNILPDKHLILRLSTMLYFNFSHYKKKNIREKKRELFSYTMLSNLKKNKKIIFDFKKNTYKDFIIPSYYAKSIDRLILNNITGTYNLCSGLKIRVEEIAKKIIYGFKKGTVLFENKNNLHQNFFMSNKLIFKKTAISISKKEIYDYCVKLGSMTNDK